MSFFVLTYLLLLWVVASAASRGQGFAFFLLGLACLAGGLIAFRLGRRSVFYALYAATLSLAVGAIGFEFVLHVAPGVLEGHVANVAYTGYHWQKGGVYTLDPHMGPDLRPNVHREMYWQGHWWQHDTNGDGFRGRVLQRADAAIVGDSMIYGHGVETSETVASHFTRTTGLQAANLGQQGACMIQCMIILQRKGVRLHPRVVFVSSHFTDMEEATQWYPPGELQRFVEAPEAEVYLPLAREQYQPRPWWDPAAIWSKHMAIPMRCSGILGAVYRMMRDGSLRRKTGPPASGPYVPAEEDLRARFAPTTPEATEIERLQWSVHRRATAEIKRICDRMGAKLVLFDIGYPNAFSRAIESLAEDVGAEYNPAGRVALARALSGEDIYLANDGHWTSSGCAVVAAELAKSYPDGSDRE